MPIKVPCRCGRVLTLPDDFAGRTGRCRACGEQLLVPFLREGGGAAVIRAESGPIELEDVAEPIMAAPPTSGRVEPDWILPLDPLPSGPLLSIVEPGEGCVLAGLRAVVRVACWYLLAMGLLGGVVRGDVASLLTATVAGIVLLLTGSRSSRGVPEAVKAVLCLVAAGIVVFGLIGLLNGR